MVCTPPGAPPSNESFDVRSQAASSRSANAAATPRTCLIIGTSFAFVPFSIPGRAEVQKMLSIKIRLNPPAQILQKKGLTNRAAAVIL